MAKQIDIGDLSEAVITSVQRALSSAKQESVEKLYIRPPRIICGFIIDPSEVPLDPVVDPLIIGGPGHPEIQ